MEIILGIIAYIFIGGVIAGLVDSPDLEGVCRFAWPLIVLFAIIFFIGEAGIWLVDKIRDIWQDTIDIEKEET